MKQDMVRVRCGWTLEIISMGHLMTKDPRNFFSHIAEILNSRISGCLLSMNTPNDKIKIQNDDSENLSLIDQNSSNKDAFRRNRNLSIPEFGQESVEKLQ